MRRSVQPSVSLIIHPPNTRKKSSVSRGFITPGRTFTRVTAFNSARNRRAFAPSFAASASCFARYSREHVRLQGFPSVNGQPHAGQARRSIAPLRCCRCAAFFAPICCTRDREMPDCRAISLFDKMRSCSKPSICNVC
jgi:hypothetical protein